MKPPRHVGILRMPSSRTYYGPSYVNPDGEEGAVRGIRSHLCLDDGSAAFERIHARVQKEGRIEADPQVR